LTASSFAEKCAKNMRGSSPSDVIVDSRHFNSIGPQRINQWIAFACENNEVICDGGFTLTVG
jgi:hypothetical protein